MDWVGRWKTPGAPGKFQVLVDGTPLKETFGPKGAGWSWHDGGSVSVTKPEVTLALHALTGFNGRCDATRGAATASGSGKAVLTSTRSANLNPRATGTSAPSWARSTL